jgi:hypothetical protein
MLAIAALGTQARAGTMFEQLCMSTPTPVPDPGSIQFDLDLGAFPGSLESITLDAAIDTQWIGDITIELSHAGTSVVVMNQVAWQSHPFGCGGNDMLATFTDGSAVTPGSLCDNTTVPMLSGDIAPAQALGAFDGADPSGIWSVTITDLNAYDQATVQQICLNLAINDAPACDGDANGDNLVDVNDISYVLFRLGDSGTPGEVDGDANQDGVVDVNDISYVLFRLGIC